MKIRVLGNEIVDAELSFVSLVKRGANRSPFKIIKAEDVPQHLQELPDGIGVDKTWLERGGKHVEVSYLFKQGDPREFITFITPQTRIVDGKAVTALAAFKFVEGVGDVVVGWVNADGSIVDEEGNSIEKGVVRKQQVPPPGGVMEVAADSDHQRADRERIEQQQRLERREIELQHELDDLNSDVFPGQSSLTGRRVAMREIHLELRSVRSRLNALRSGTVEKADAHPLDGIERGVTSRGMHQERHDFTDDFAGDPFGLRQDPNNIRKEQLDEIDLGTPFASMESAARAIKQRR